MGPQNGYFEEFFTSTGDVLLIPDGRNGGARMGSGRKSAAELAAQDAELEDEGVDTYAVSRARKEQALADKEVVLAKKAILDYEIQAGSYVPREAVVRAAATGYATVVQAMRSIPDNLERRLGLDPTVTEAIEIAIDEALADLEVQLDGIAPPEDA